MPWQEGGRRLEGMGLKGVLSVGWLSHCGVQWGWRRWGLFKVKSLPVRLRRGGEDGGGRVCVELWNSLVDLR